MNKYVYKTWKNIEEPFLMRFGAEMDFSVEANAKIKLRAQMPFIILAESQEEANSIKEQIENELEDKFSFKLERKSLQNLNTNNEYKRQKDRIEDRLKSEPKLQLQIQTCLDKIPLGERIPLISVTKEKEYDIVDNTFLDFIIVHNALKNTMHFEGLLLSVHFDHPNNLNN